MLFHRQRPHVQQRAGAVKEGDAVVGQVGERHQRILVHIAKTRPEQRRYQTVGAQKQGQRGHQAQEPAPVKPCVVDAPVGLALQQEQRRNEKPAQYKKQIHAQKRAIKQRHVRVRQDHQQDGDTAQPIQGGVVAQREVSCCQIHAPFSNSGHDSGFLPMETDSRGAPLGRRNKKAWAGAALGHFRENARARRACRAQLLAPREPF